MSKSNLVDIEIELVAETEKAFLVHTGDETKKVWVPKSMCEIDDGVLTTTESLALDKGLL